MVRCAFSDSSMKATAQKLGARMPDVGKDVLTLSVLLTVPHTMPHQTAQLHPLECNAAVKAPSLGSQVIGSCIVQS